MERIFLIDLLTDNQIEIAINEAGLLIGSKLNDLDELSNQLVERLDVDYVVVNTDLPSSQLFKVCHELIERLVKPVIVFTENSTKRFTEDATNIGISAYIVNGFDAKRMKHIMQLASARFNEINSLKSELEKTRSTLAERKVIEKAKGIIMKRKTIDEEEAFQLMRKMAMDKNQKMSEVAKSIINVDSMLAT